MSVLTYLLECRHTGATRILAARGPLFYALQIPRPDYAPNPQSSTLGPKAFGVSRFLIRLMLSLRREMFSKCFVSIL